MEVLLWFSCWYLLTSVYCCLCSCSSKMTQQSTAVSLEAFKYPNVLFWICFQFQVHTTLIQPELHLFPRNDTRFAVITILMHPHLPLLAYVALHSSHTNIMAFLPPIDLQLDWLIPLACNPRWGTALWPQCDILWPICCSIDIYEWLAIVRALQITCHLLGMMLPPTVKGK
jgi:hypothetical protein